MSPIKAAARRVLRSSPSSIVSVPVSRAIASTTRNATSMEQLPSAGAGHQIYSPQDFYPRKPTITRAVQRPVINSFTTLFTDLTHALTRPGPPPTVAELKRIMSTYTSDQSEWERYAYSNASKQYTRNLVMEVPGVFNLLLLVWTPGKQSPIHDHVNSHCVMRILQGELTEKRYAWPSPSTASTTPSSDPSTSTEPMHELSSKTYTAGKVAYMCDAMGLHSIANPSEGRKAYSLHLYTPPNAAMRGCYMFDEQTGKAVHVKQGPYDSVGGRERGEL